MTDEPDDTPEEPLAVPLVEEEPLAVPLVEEEPLAVPSDEDEPPGVPPHVDVDVDFASYVFPDMAQRRITAWILWGIGGAGLLLWVFLRGRWDWITTGALIGSILLLVLGAWFRAASWPLGLDQGEALVIATREVGFAVGHASAVLGWRGWRSRPVWRILLYSSEEPPTRRGLVELDAIDGSVFAAYQEENPEDWDALRREEAERPS
jgi:hypothetical protein